MATIEELRAYSQSLESTPPADDAGFTRIINDASTFLAMTDRDLSEAFTVSRPTISRWKGGQSVPHALMRAGIYSALLQKAKGVLRTLERQSKNTKAPSKSKGASVGGRVNSNENAMVAKSRD